MQGKGSAVLPRGGSGSLLWGALSHMQAGFLGRDRAEQYGKGQEKAPGCGSMFCRGGRGWHTCICWTLANGTYL